MPQQAHAVSRQCVVTGASLELFEQLTYSNELLGKNLQQAEW